MGEGDPIYLISDGQRVERVFRYRIVQLSWATPTRHSWVAIRKIQYMALLLVSSNKPRRCFLATQRDITRYEANPRAITNRGNPDNDMQDQEEPTAIEGIMRLYIQKGNDGWICA